jgi:Asp/Glu/hydantoin racemase
MSNLEHTAVRRGPRIALIHALAESLQPIHEAFDEHWPEAVTFDVFDSSLAPDLAHAGVLEQSMIDRFLTLGHYAANAAGEGGRTAGILFTCSAFGPAIDAVKAALPMPVLRPNEATFDRALSSGRHIGLLVTFPPSLPALESELRAMAAERGVEITVTSRVIEGALEALQRGDAQMHDRLAAAVAERMPPTDCLILGQFSLARAARAIKPVAGREVLTTPRRAVEQLRAMLANAT